MGLIDKVGRIQIRSKAAPSTEMVPECTILAGVYGLGNCPSDCREGSSCGLEALYGVREICGVGYLRPLTHLVLGASLGDSRRERAFPCVCIRGYVALRNEQSNERAVVCK